MLALAGFYGLINVVAAVDSVVPIRPMELLNTSLYGVGFAFYLVPFGLLAGWVSGEISLGLAKVASAHLSQRPNRRRITTAVSTALASLMSCLLLSLVFGLQAPYFYGIISVVVFGVALLADRWLNPPKR